MNNRVRNYGRLNWATAEETEEFTGRFRVLGWPGEAVAEHHKSHLYMILVFDQDLDQGGDQLLETVHMYSGDYNITRYGGEDENDSANWSEGPEEAHVIPRPIILAFERLWREQFSSTVGFSMKWDFERPKMLYVEFEVAQRIRDRARYICSVAAKLSKWSKELAE